MMAGDGISNQFGHTSINSIGCKLDDLLRSGRRVIDRLTGAAKPALESGPNTYRDRGEGPR